MSPLDDLQTLCIEAAEMFGDDWGSIQRYISQKLAELVESERADLAAEISRILSFQAPANDAARRIQ